MHTNTCIPMHVHTYIPLLSFTGLNIWFTTMFWTSISNLANSCTKRSVSYNDRNSGMQTHTNVDISCRGSCTRCSIQEEDHVSTLYACIQPFKQLTGFLNSAFTCSTAGIHSATLPPTSEGSWPSNGSS